MNYKLLVFVIIVGIFVSCGSSKTTKKSAITDAEVSRVIKNHYKKEVDFNTLQGRLRLHYKDANTNQAVTVSFRMKKGDTIWMSGKILGFPLAKALITPNSVMYYEKFNQTYFNGDFRLLSNLLGTPIDFKKLQNLLLGQAIYNLNREAYALVDSSRGYQLAPTTQDFLKKMFLIDVKTYKILAQQLSQETQNKNLMITYPEYQEIDGQKFPKRIKIIANDGAQNSIIEMEFRSVEFNVPVSFPFSIPSGYEEITIE